MSDHRPHALYRFYGAGDTLLYIGLTADLPTRLGNHRDEKPWWTTVARITVEHYPDRQSVTEAERRAIIAERPLFNIQHNRSEPLTQCGGPRLGAARYDFTPTCDGCGKTVFGSKSAVIHVSMQDVKEYRERKAEWEQRRREEADEFAGEFGKTYGVLPLSARLLLEHPKEARWQIHCDGCNPHWDDERIEACTDCYWFSLDRCRSHGELLRWTAHLMGKEWFQCTDWDQLIYRLTKGVREP